MLWNGPLQHDYLTWNVSVYFWSHDTVHVSSFVIASFTKGSESVVNGTHTTVQQSVKLSQEASESCSPSASTVSKLSNTKNTRAMPAVALFELIIIFITQATWFIWYSCAAEATKGSACLVIWTPVWTETDLFKRWRREHGTHNKQGREYENMHARAWIQSGHIRSH